MRLFFGFKLSSELVKILSRTQSRLLRSIPTGFALSSLDQLHLTLLFLGDRPAEELATWKTVLETKLRGINSFEISLLELNAFPNPKDPRVVWAGINEQSGALQAIVARLRDAANEIGCKTEDQKFVPHLTLGRNKIARNSTSLRLFIEREKLPDYLEKIQTITLFESTPTPSGHLYTAVATKELEGGNVIL